MEQGSQNGKSSAKVTYISQFLQAIPWHVQTFFSSVFRFFIFLFLHERVAFTFRLHRTFPHLSVILTIFSKAQLPNPNAKICNEKFLFNHFRTLFQKKSQTSLQKFSEECADLKNKLPEGASSIAVPTGDVTWQAFTDIIYQGASVILEPGRKYESPEKMGLTKPVKSFRK